MVNSRITFWGHHLVERGPCPDKGEEMESIVERRELNLHFGAAGLGLLPQESKTEDVNRLRAIRQALLSNVHQNRKMRDNLLPEGVCAISDKKKQKVAHRARSVLV